MIESNPMYMEYVNDCVSDDKQPDGLLTQSDIDALHDENAEYLRTGECSRKVYREVKRAIFEMQCLLASAEIDCCADAPTWGDFWEESRIAEPQRGCDMEGKGPY